MAVEPDPFHASEWRGARLTARVAEARARGLARRAGALADLRLDDDSRLTDRIRFEVTSRLRTLAETVARDLSRQAERLAPDGAPLNLPPPAELVDRLRETGALAEPELVTELVAQARQALLAESLPIDPVAGDARSLLVRLAEAPDRIVVAAARHVLAAEGRARVAGLEDEAVGLPTDLYHRLVWTVAAALRQGGGAGQDGILAQAAERVLAAQDVGDRLEAAALRLAAAIDARATELPDLLIECLSDRQLSVFIALLAHAAGIEPDVVRDLVLEPEGDRLWLALRAIDLDRPTIARIGISLCEADRRRDEDGFADALDAIMAVPPADARLAIASLTLPRPFRDAVERLEGFARR
ncbi:DUF2336 domain-containing protein [uncultured Sphingomonas sp.]|uniref:DUF2336 domain-containing protein n=1 Tax=uncultured Sphingomonas sp. TaxID=158754 RepID=UPI0025D0508C|nr:DUF2336 domain-containing protein [uncultured Sphingomonas sp.]